MSKGGEGAEGKKELEGRGGELGAKEAQGHPAGGWRL